MNTGFWIDYESKGHRFESCVARQIKAPKPVVMRFLVPFVLYKNTMNYEKLFSVAYSIAYSKIFQKNFLKPIDITLILAYNNNCKEDVHKQGGNTMKKTYQIKPWMELELTPCTAIDETGERKSAIFVHRQGPIIDLPMFDEVRNSVIFGV